MIIRSGLCENTWRHRVTIFGDWLAKLTFWMKAAPVCYPTREQFERVLSANGLRVRIQPLWGRTPFNNLADAKGREHHNWAFSSWLAGAGVKPGIVHGETDEYGIRVARDPVHVHDFQATLLHLLGVDHERLTFRFQGRQYRLTDVHGNVVREVLA